MQFLYVLIILLLALSPRPIILIRCSTNTQFTPSLQPSYALTAYLQIHKLKEALLANLQVHRLIDDPLYLSLRQFRKLIVRYLVLAIQLHQGFRCAIKGLPFFLLIYLPPPRQQHIVIHHIVQPLPFHLLSFLLSSLSLLGATAPPITGAGPTNSPVFLLRLTSPHNSPQIAMHCSLIFFSYVE